MDKQRAVLVGCGNITGQWMPPLLARPDCELVGLVDINLETAKACAERNKLEIPVFTELVRAIRETRATLVLDLTIPAAHKSVVTTALRNGCHVFGEKPMAESLADAREMVAAAEQHGRRYAVLQNYRYNKWVRSYKALLASGKIGELGSLYADFFVGPHMPGFRETMASPLILDMSIHTFDVARFLAGGDPATVWCKEFNPRWSWFKGDASAIAVFEFTNGVVFEYRGSWCAEGAWTSWACSWRACGSVSTALWQNTPVSDRIVLDTFKAGADRKAWWEYQNWQQTEVPPTWDGLEGHAGCLADMFAALREDRPAETDCRDNIKSIAMVLAALESSRSGRTVKVEW